MALITLRQLLDHAAEHGYDGFTLPEVGRRAGVSNGGMYWRVDSKQALLAAIHEQYLERVNAHVDVFYSRADLQERIVATIADTGTRRRSRAIRYAILGSAAAVVLAVGLAIGLNTGNESKPLEYSASLRGTSTLKRVSVF